MNKSFGAHWIDEEGHWDIIDENPWDGLTEEELDEMFSYNVFDDEDIDEMYNVFQNEQYNES